MKSTPGIQTLGPNTSVQPQILDYNSFDGPLQSSNQRNSQSVEIDHLDSPADYGTPSDSSQRGSSSSQDSTFNSSQIPEFEDLGEQLSVGPSDNELPSLSLSHNRPDRNLDVRYVHDGGVFDANDENIIIPESDIAALATDDFEERDEDDNFEDDIDLGEDLDGSQEIDPFEDGEDNQTFDRGIISSEPVEAD